MEIEKGYVPEKPADYDGKVQFPKVIYYPGGKSKVVADETELANAKPGWAENPLGVFPEPPSDSKKK